MTTMCTSTTSNKCYVKSDPSTARDLYSNERYSHKRLDLGTVKKKE